MDLLNQIPDWFGEAICLAIGWIMHVLYLMWKDHKRPYEQDRERFDEIIKSIDPYAVAAFENVTIDCFSAIHCEQLMHASCEIELTDRFGKSCLDKELKIKEQALVTAIDKITYYIAWKSFYKSGGNTWRTFLWDNYNSSDPEQLAEADKIKNEIEQYGKVLYKAYLDYKCYGDKKFAIKISDK